MRRSADAIEDPFDHIVPRRGGNPCGGELRQFIKQIKQQSRELGFYAGPPGIEIINNALKLLLYLILAAAVDNVSDGQKIVLS